MLWHANVHVLTWQCAFYGMEMCILWNGKVKPTNPCRLNVESRHANDALRYQHRYLAIPRLLTVPLSDHYMCEDSNIRNIRERETVLIPFCHQRTV